MSSVRLLRYCPWALAAVLGCAAEQDGPAAVGVGERRPTDEKVDGGPLGAPDAALVDSGSPLNVQDASDGPLRPLDTRSRFPALADAGPGDLPVSDAAVPPDAADGLAEVDGAVFSASCFSGGQTVLPDVGGDGSCAAPFRVDLRDLAFGEVAELPSILSVADAPVPSLDKCGAGTTRDLAFVVLVPPGADLAVTVEAGPGADPLVMAFSEPTQNCGAATVQACVDATGEDGCEFLRLFADSELNGGQVELLVSEVVATTTPITMRLRVELAGSGA